MSGSDSTQTAFIGCPVAADAPLAALLMRIPAPLYPLHPDDLHFTLAFLGRCTAEQAQSAWAQCRRAPPPAVHVNATRYAWFGRPNRPRVLALEPVGDAVLRDWMAAHRAAICAAAGVDADQRPPRPHLSLARLGASLDRGTANELLNDLPMPDAAGLHLTEIALYRRAGADAPSGGPRYRTIERQALISAGP